MALSCAVTSRLSISSSLQFLFINIINFSASVYALLLVLDAASVACCCVLAVKLHGGVIICDTRYVEQDPVLRCKFCLQMHCLLTYTRSLVCGRPMTCEGTVG